MSDQRQQPPEAQGTERSPRTTAAVRKRAAARGGAAAGDGAAVGDGGAVGDGAAVRDGAAVGDGAAVRGGPEPEGLRFFGTTWLEHDGGYALRRVAVAAGSLITAFASCLVLRFAYDGIALADVGSFVGILVVVMFAVCSAVAFRRTWVGFAARPADPGREESLRSLKAIGFIGSLIAYFIRSLTEAPGEGLRRREYEAAVVAYERRRTARSGNPRARRAARTASKNKRVRGQNPPAGAGTEGVS